MSNKGKFEQDLDRLINSGELLLQSIGYEFYGDQILTQNTQKQSETERFYENLPNFTEQYQTWYSEALALVKQVLPDRLNDFNSYYEFPRVRKNISFQNYRIHDYLLSVLITRGLDDEIVADGRAAVLAFEQQLNIVKSTKLVLTSSLFNLTSILQADLFDSELDSARALGKAGYMRAAGAICGVVIEKHLKQVCKKHNITIRKKRPTISDLSQILKDNNSISIPQWRFVQHLADIRNICDHDRGKEPQNNEIDDLLSGTSKVLKTIS